MKLFTKIVPPATQEEWKGVVNYSMRDGRREGMNVQLFLIIVEQKWRKFSLSDFALSPLQAW